MAFMPEPQTRLMVVALVVSARPAASAAWRGCLAGPGLQHLAHEHLVDAVTVDPGTLHRGADGDAAKHRRGTFARLPPNRPMGVRMAETMKTCPFEPL